MKRVYNFNAGPSAMPLEVLKEVQDEFLDFNGTGMSIVESVIAVPPIKLCRMIRWPC